MRRTAKPDLILIATGSEVGLDRGGSARNCWHETSHVRIVSMPSWELFDAQPQEYRDAVLPPSISARLAVEAGVVAGLASLRRGSRRRAGRGSVRRVGPGRVLMREYGFTVENVCRRALAMLG